MKQGIHTLVVEHTVNEDGLKNLRKPRQDLVQENQLETDYYGLAQGPFSHYKRTLKITPVSSTDNYHVVEKYTWKLAVPVWGALFWWPVRRALRLRNNHNPWWAPPDRLDTRSAEVLSLLACFQVVDGYLGTVITQTITFAADEFKRGNTAQGATLAMVRIGVLIALIVVVLADKKGRRKLLLSTAILAIATTTLGALSPGIWFLGSSQLIARGLTTGLGILVGVFAAEELPKGSRAYGVSILTLAAALGAGMAVWILPVADLGEKGWRVIYLVPILFLPGLIAAWLRLPESRRFIANQKPDSFSPRTTQISSTPRRSRHNEKQRLLLLAATAFLLLVFAAPASQFQNDFLKDHRGFTASGITLYTLLTSTPAGIGIFAAGRLADTRGRRHIAAIGLTIGTTFIIASYYTFGILMWGAHLVGVIFASLTVALGVYGPELFSTRTRARANGIIISLGVIGSSTGLVLVGLLADFFNSYGHAFAIVGIGPILAATLVIGWFPETARTELEDLNPQDTTL